MQVPRGVVDDPRLRGRTRVFRDRRDAGEHLAGLLETLRGSFARVFAIPAGGVPVGAALAATLSLPLDVAVASKITPAWDTEVGFGAVAFDGSVRVDEGLVARLGLSPEEVREGIERTLEKVRRRVRELRSAEAAPDVRGRPVVLVDDGLAAGVTLEAALCAMQRLGAGHVIVAVPTGPDEPAARLARAGALVVCANLRPAHSFVVADAYRAWSEVSDEELRERLPRYGSSAFGRFDR